MSQWRLILALWAIAVTLFLIIVGLSAAPKGHADMCGPQPGLPGGSYPWVQSCNIWVPFVPGVRLPLPGPGSDAMAPIPGVGGMGGWGPSSYPWGSYNPLPYTPAVP